MNDPPPCFLKIEGKAVVVYVEGFDVVQFESKGYDWDLGMLEGQFKEWGLPASGPVFDKLHHDLQTAHSGGTEGEGGRQGRENGKEKDRGQRAVVSVPFWEDGQACYEAVMVGGSSVFLARRKGAFVTVDSVSSGAGFDLYPIQLSKHRYVLAPEDFDADPQGVADLYGRVHDIFSRYFAHPDPRVLKFSALYVLHSYVLTRSNGTIFVWLVGRKRAGKTTAQMLFEALGYRAVKWVSPSEAAVYWTLGYVSEYAPMIIVGEYERASDFMKEIIREGDIPGATVPRVIKDETGNHAVRAYFLYGSRVPASNLLHGDEVDMDRYIVFRCLKMKPRRPRAELYRNPDVLAELETLRRDLLFWKIAGYSTLIFPVEDPRGGLDGRDWDHYGGLLHLAGQISPEFEDEMRAFVLEYLKGTEAEASDHAPEILLAAVENLATDASRDLEETPGFYVPFGKIWEEVKKSCPPYIENNGDESRTKVVTPDGRVLSTTRAAGILKDQLLGKPARRKVNKERGYFWADKTLKSLRSEPGQVGRLGQVRGTKGEGSHPSEGQHETEMLEAAESPSEPPKAVHPVQPVQAAEEAGKP